MKTPILGHCVSRKGDAANENLTPRAPAARDEALHGSPRQCAQLQRITQIFGDPHPARSVVQRVGEEEDMDWSVPDTGGIHDLDLLQDPPKGWLIDAIAHTLEHGYFARDHVATDAVSISAVLKKKPRHTVIERVAVRSIAAEILEQLAANNGKRKNLVAVMQGRESSKSLGELKFNLNSTVNGWDYSFGSGGAATIRRVELTLIDVSNNATSFTFHFVPRTS